MFDNPLHPTAGGSAAPSARDEEVNDGIEALIAAEPDNRTSMSVANLDDVDSHSEFGMFDNPLHPTAGGSEPPQDEEVIDGFEAFNAGEPDNRPSMNVADLDDVDNHTVPSSTYRPTQGRYFETEGFADTTAARDMMTQINERSDSERPVSSSDVTLSRTGTMDPADAQFNDVSSILMQAGGLPDHQEPVEMD
jgi:hypothetical protein